MQNIKYQIKISKSNQRIVSIDNFSLESHKINFLLGESGIGKTMLAKAIFGLLDHTLFQATINGENYSHYLKKEKTIDSLKDGFFVFQEPSSHFNPLLKIGTQLKEGGLATGKKENDILNQLWVDPNDDYLHSLLKLFPKPYRPSGGEKQRFLLVMASKKIDLFIRDSNLTNAFFIFDEPTGSLDDNLRNLFIKLLFGKYKQKQFTILFITHDYSIISEVVNNYKDLKDKVSFNEIAKQHDSVILERFNEENYLSWLKNNQRFKHEQNKKTGKELLLLNSEIEVFDKTLKIFKDAKLQQSSQLKIHNNEIVYLKAPSGTGKTTIANIIMGLIKAKKFDLDICGLKINQKTPPKIWKTQLWGKNITMSFQHADEALNLKSTVKQTLLNLPRQKRPKKDEVLSKLKMIYDSEIDESFLKKRIWQLSGGQKQRLNLLRALLLDTPILILDEPLNGLDFNSIQRIIDLLIKRKEQGTGILIISHNEEIIDTIVAEASIYYLAHE